MKTQCLQTNEMQHSLGKENALEAGGGVERVVLIQSLIYTRKKECMCVCIHVFVTYTRAYVYIRVCVTYALRAQGLPSSAEKSQLIEAHSYFIKVWIVYQPGLKRLQ